MTPLAISAYNPDVSPTIVQLLCTLEPKAMEKECKFHGQPIPLIIAAASPLPPKLSAGYNDAKMRRWEKVKLMILSKAWYDEQNEILLKAVDSSETPDKKSPLLTASPPPEPTLQQVQYACEEAIQRNEWELVREFLKHYHTGYTASKVGVELVVKGDEFQPIQTALGERDKKVNTTNERKLNAQEKAQAREEWLHNNMGLAMYPINAVLDLVSAVIPTSMNQDDADSGIVSPMS